MTRTALHEDRFTSEDRERIAARLDELADAQLCVGADTAAGERIAAHAIGCSLVDLRDVERDYIARAVRRRLGLAPTWSRRPIDEHTSAGRQTRIQQPEPNPTADTQHP